MEKTAEKKHIRLSRGDRVFVTINGILLALFFVIELYPMIYVLSASFSDPLAVGSGEMLLWPVKPSLQGYQYILQYKTIWSGYLNTIFYTVVGTLLNLAVTIPCAYALSRRDFPDKGIFMTLFMFTMYFSGGTIPAYLNYKSFGLLNTRWVLIICGAMSVYNMIVARTFFASSIPWELHEAARIDGASDIRMFFSIVLPLSKAIMAVMVLYYGVGHWNEYFSAMLYLPQAKNLWPLQLVLRDILIKSSFAKDAISDGVMDADQMMELLRQQDTANMMKYCVIVAATVPMLVIYPFLQKYFAKGVMIGSVKG